VPNQIRTVLEAYRESLFSELFPAVLADVGADAIDLIRDTGH
jgi:hypothetical protein